MSIHFNLRIFRYEQKILQNDIAELFGISQSTLSRMESTGKELDGHQYEKLAKRYGKELVSQYVKRESVENAMGYAKRRPGPKSSGEYLAIIKSQQEEITRLHRRIEELTDLLLKK